MNVTVVGLGKIGVPLSVQFASKGARVTGYDVSAARVAEINAARNPLVGEPGIDELLTAAVAAGTLRATTAARDAVGDADVVVLIVPVDVDAAHHPDFSALDAAVDAIAPHLRRGVAQSPAAVQSHRTTRPDPGDHRPSTTDRPTSSDVAQPPLAVRGRLIIVETTVPVGTTRQRVGARIAAATRMTPGTDFALAFSPERVSSGSVLRDLRIYPKVVGGIDAASTERAVAFYRAMLDAEVMAIRDAETAEFSKLAETTYRDVNIALANEFARIGDRLSVDVLQAIDAANTQPYSHIHGPGVGVGGHCIPVYPYFLREAVAAAPDEAALIAAAREINDGMAAYAVGRLGDALGTLEGATVVVLGLAYRAGVKEWRHSSAFGLVAALRAAGARAYVHDPLFSDDEVRACGLEPPPAFPLAADALVVQAWHPAYRPGGACALDLRAFAGLRAVLDGRAALDPAWVEATGVHYVGIGR